VTAPSLLLSFHVLLAAPPIRPAPPAAVPAVPARPADSVVKVHATVRYPNPIRPWARPPSREVSGSGVVIAGNKILTNAHLVQYATEVQVQSRPGADKIDARVESIGPAMDLAVLTVADPTFFARRPPLPRARAVPRLRDSVEVYGFPVGGADLAVTKGVVSRIGYSRYGSGTVGLLLQVSAAINPGNSGGPAVVGGKMVGLVFSRLRDAENVGYVIPNEEIDLYLDDVKDGRYDGKPFDATWSQYQRLENPALRALVKLDRRTRGVLVVPPRRPLPGSPFREFDVLTRIGAHDIDNEGMVRLPDGLRIPFVGLIPRLARGNAVPVTVVRAGKCLPLALPVTTRDDRLVREFQGEQPSYFIHGPLVFSPVKQEAIPMYLQVNPGLSERSPLFVRRDDRVRFPGEELVVITSPMFEHKIARGYDEPLGQVLAEVNGQKVKNLRHLIEILRDSTEEFLTFRFAEEGADVMVFRRAEMDRVTAEILEDAGIAPSRRGSPDMLAVWRKRAARGK
jgi:S1-C subfamily serine protease